MSEQRQCEWPVFSLYGFDARPCARGGVARHRSGVALCWQHAEAWAAEMAQRIEDGQVDASQLARLIDALLVASRSGEEGEYGTPARRAGHALDRLLEERLADTWGATA